MENVVGYVRVSVEDERPENQIIAIQDFCKSRDYNLVEIFQDVGISGAKPCLERPGFKKMIEFCEKTRIKTIIVFDITRLGRDLYDLILIMKWFQEHNYKVIFIKHPDLSIGVYQTSSPLEKMSKDVILIMYSLYAQLERTYISERTKQGLERAKREGKQIGRPPKIRLDELKEKLQQLLCVEKLSKYEVARKLNINISQVYYWIKKLKIKC